MKRSALRKAVLLGTVSSLAAACSESPSPMETREPVPGPAMAVYDGTDLVPDVINGGQWTPAYDPGTSVGTGVIRPFLDMQAKGNATMQSGFNTDNNAFQYDQHRTSDTNALPLNYVPILIDPVFPGGGAAAREFVLDAHESDNHFVIEEFEVWICDVAAAATYSLRSQFSSGNDHCKQVYSIHDHTLNATDQYSSGSGNVFDYRILIPETLFQAAAALLPNPGLCAYDPTAAGTAACGKYLIVWSSMSGVGSTFEEFSTILRPVPGTLRLVKRVVNDNGGGATVADFDLATDAGALVFDAGVADGPNTIKYTSEAIPVVAGPYTFSEANVAGYAEGTWSCMGATATGTAFDAGSVTIADEQAVVCSITNDDIAPSLTLDKITSYSYGGTRPESDWTLTANGGAAGMLTGPGAAGSADVVSTGTFQAGIYALSETGSYTGYQNGTTFSCVKNGAAPVPGNSITLAVGDVAVCSITNTDLPGSITIVKNVAGAGSTFDFNTTGNGLSSFSLSPASNDTDSETFIGLSAGQYTVMEVLAAGYTLTGLECTTGGTTDYPGGSTATINLPLGGSVTCTFENTYNTLVTRTQGFWSTHLWIAEAVWTGGTVGGNTFPGMSAADRTLCGVVLDIDDVMGGFWANLARTTSNTKRSDLDHARMRLLQQLLAAMLNQAAFGSAPGGAISIADAKAAFCGTDIAAINAAMSAMASFNESGDSELFTPGVSANAKDARALADRAFWDVLPPTP